MTHQLVSESKAPNGRRDFVKFSVFGLLAGLFPTIPVSAAHGSARQDIQRKRSIYNQVQAFVKELQSNKKAFNAFKKQLEQFHGGVREGGDIQRIGTDLVNSNEKLIRIRQQNSEGNDPQAIIVIIIIIILILIPLTAG